MNACESILGLSPYQGGKPIDELARELGLKNITKLASNENPLGVSESVKEAVFNSLSSINRYPDGNCFELKKAIAEKLSVMPDMISLGNGSNELLELIARVFVSKKTDEVIFSQYAFVVYPLVTQALGATAKVSPAKNYGYDLNSMLSLISENTKLIFVANPNNPTGTLLSDDQLYAFLQKVPNDVPGVLDQAYFDYASYENSDVGFEFINEFPNLIISRSFSKAYGLAGFRVGYSVSSKEIADFLNRVRQPFNTNSLALAAAEAALSDKDHMLKSLKMNIEQKSLLYKGLEDLGYQYIPSAGNFICFDCKQDAEQLFNKLLKEGVIVRSMGVYKMPNHLRVTIGLPEENNIFLEKLAKVGS